MSATREISRRTVMRGMLQGGAAVAVGLPVLECFLNTNGTAYAATAGAAAGPLPPCFGTWFWGLGLTPNHWEPATTGPDYELPAHLAGLQPIKSKLNLFSGMQVFLDGKVNQNHYSGAQGQATGMVSRNGSDYSTSIDTLIGEQIGRGTRFRSLEVTCDGDSSASWSARGSSGLNPSETSAPGAVRAPLRRRLPGSERGRFQGRPGGDGAAQRALRRVRAAEKADVRRLRVGSGAAGRVLLVGARPGAEAGVRARPAGAAAGLHGAGRGNGGDRIPRRAGRAHPPAVCATAGPRDGVRADADLQSHDGVGILPGCGGPER